MWKHFSVVLREVMTCILGNASSLWKKKKNPFDGV